MTASGVLHEIDVVTHLEPTLGILELKNRAGWPPEKNDIIVFFAKILDYLCLTPGLLRAYLAPTFLSTYPFDMSGLAACMGLGIHPVAPQLRPLPILLHNAKCMLREMEAGIPLSSSDGDAFEDFHSR